MKLDRVLFLNENQVGDVLLSTPLVTGLPFINEVVVYDKGDPV